MRDISSITEQFLVGHFLVGFNSEQPSEHSSWKNSILTHNSSDSLGPNAWICLRYLEKNTKLFSQTVVKHGDESHFENPWKNITNKPQPTPRFCEAQEVQLQ